MFQCSFVYNFSQTFENEGRRELGLNMGKVQSNKTCSVYMYVYKHYKLCLTVLYPYYDPIQHNGDVSS